ncbi:uncharacterized protein LOC112086507 [Eutrema salsugineum]|uniref:uncharacterized protein LOC112086507 n=1 Tax=Eutrema salsugineum TaxID=72664 RepID=UPI000CED35CD|nr:uncharacterized protein LOC112086507 [Eutrema salsugineum]
MHRFEGVKEGPIPREIMEFMRSEYGCEISYQHAWDAREYAVSVARGIPEKGYGKIRKYLHMLKQANPGTHTHFETDSDNRFKYLFIAFGQSIRGFYRAMRRVIVVDGTFLKSKYKGVLLVATALDGDSSLYPIAFGVVDSENDRSWEWFFRQLLVVIADGQGVAFVSDRNVSVTKALARVYPHSSHGICIHHLLSNVASHFKTKGLVGLIAKASKEYRVSEFERRFNDIRNISPLVAKYLMEAGVEKWARCKFSGFRYDIRTTNPAESMNSVLLAPREFPVIPLLDSIREMLTKWYTTAVWRIAYKESINPIAVPEDAWVVPLDIENSKVLAPETRRAAGRRRKRRYETVEDVIRFDEPTAIAL